MSGRKPRNTFSRSSSVHIYVIHNDDVILEFDTLISGLGDDEEREFYLRTSEIDEILALEELRNNDNGFNFELRIAKIVNGKQCKYYYRVLQPLEIRQNTSNKLGFSKNIYSDDIVQYLYNSPIDTSTIRDHLGRPITELYATVLKRHKGDYIWYNKKQEIEGWNGTFTQEEVNEIEYNHCFGNLTAGLDLPVELDDYNVHKIHNVPKVNEINKQWKDLDETLKRPESIKLDKSEHDITSESKKFIGDLVEFNPYSFDETVIEKMYYRFNTKQREMYSKEFDEYHVAYGNALRQRLVLKLDSTKAFRIIDSDHILKLDSASQALALKVGVPVNDISDIHLADLMVESSPFIDYLKTGNDLAEKLDVETSTYRFHEWDDDATLYYDVRNNSKSTIKGSDYKVELEIYQASTGQVRKVMTVKGKDISPGGRAHFETIYKNGCELAIMQDLGWNTRFVFNTSVIEQLLNIEWTGSEYNNYKETCKAFQN